ncbi:hypothetical protein [Dyadobacter fermentans]|uniref:hypothetical protein n=1 Tax=Dyadobacter fermentans TaxID=94254 RepID=UPI00019B57DF|nr:hypothetical protein [Dyadobacter fermentans]
MEILSNVVWRFKKSIPTRIEEFDEVFTRYQSDILGEKAKWDSQVVVINNSIIRVGYTAWLNGPEDLFDNEISLESQDFFEDINNSGSDGLYQTDIMFELIADNGRNFTAIELMYKVSHHRCQRSWRSRVLRRIAGMSE